MTIEDLVSDAIQTGGGTYGISVEGNGAIIGFRAELDSGYMVSLGNFEVRLSGDLTYGIVREYVLDMVVSSRNINYCLGLWKDGGYWYIDTSEWYNCAVEARREGRNRNQLAIWNCSTGNAETL